MKAIHANKANPRGKRNPTLNYPPDEHMIFCMRCQKRHGGCPNPPPSRCSL